MKPKKNYVPGPQDNCQTPPYAITPLIQLISDMTVWEPAAGQGYLVRALKEMGHKVFASDIMGKGVLANGVKYHDFFEPFPSWGKSADVQITNPPFSWKFRWIERSYELGIPFALLLPMETLGAKSAQQFFQAGGMGLIVLDQRINFLMPTQQSWTESSAQFPVAWFTHGLGIDGQIVYASISEERKQWLSTL